MKLVTTAICTWNRSRILDQTLRKLSQLEIPAGVEWELLVINNNSTDDTDAVIARHSHSLPIRGLFEGTPGKANACNRAIDEAAGDLIVWTDDDVEPCANWLMSYVEATEALPEVGLFGGPIEPVYEGDPPGWLGQVTTQVANAYGMRDFGDEAFSLTADRIPYGANYAVRTEIQRRFRFDPTLGVNGTKRIGGYETSVMRQMLDSGVQGHWLPEARIGHLVRKETQTIGFLRHYFAAQGHADALGRDENGSHVATFLGRPRWLVRKAVQAELRYRFHRVFSKPEVWIDDLIESSRIWGELKVVNSR